MEAGRVVADGELAEGVAETLLYIARIADTVGYNLGAGALESLEVFGRGNAFATVSSSVDGSLAVRGCVCPSGPLPDEARVWLESRSSP
jgi:hypothetical protein